MISLSPPTICNSATSTTTCCRPRSSPHSSASRPCPCDQPEQRPVPGRAFAAAGRAVGTVTRLAKDNELPDAILTESGLKITPLDAAVPDSGAGADRPNQPVTAAHQDHRTADGRGRLDGFSRHFTHLKDGAEAKDRTLLLSAILGDAINLGLTKMAESSPGLTYAKLSWLQAWHIRDETYSGSFRLRAK